jgi:hypothetical protein
MIENTESEKIKINGLSLILRLVFQLPEISYVRMPIYSYTAIVFLLGIGVESCLVEYKNYQYQL